MIRHVVFGENNGERKIKMWESWNFSFSSLNGLFNKISVLLILESLLIKINLVTCLISVMNIKSFIRFFKDSGKIIPYTVEVA